MANIFKLSALLLAALSLMPATLAQDSEMTQMTQHDARRNRCVIPETIAQTNASALDDTCDAKKHTLSDWQEDNTPASAPMKSSAVLRGGVQLQNKLPRLSSQLSPGSSIDQAQATAALADRVPKEDQDNRTEQWRKIPRWFAGSWKVTEQTHTLSKDLVTGVESFPNRTDKLEVEYCYGDFADRQGDIWERVPKSGAWSIASRRAGSTGKSFFTKRLRVKSTDKQLADYLEGIALIQDDQGKILDTHQFASLHFIQPVGDDAYREEVRKRTYDASGNGTREDVAVSVRRRTQAFVDHPSPEIRESFCAYLHSKGLDHLAPVAPVVGKSGR
ncbi:MAG: hypothetical protein K2W95_07185 [Candidatus Obscuribacterales bacterium]|nr:hypothetical protein [Candidatus Obscuribacterales bacterium]